MLRSQATGLIEIKLGGEKLVDEGGEVTLCHREEEKEALWGAS